MYRNFFIISQAITISVGLARIGPSCLLIKVIQSITIGVLILLATNQGVKIIHCFKMVKQTVAVCILSLRIRAPNIRFLSIIKTIPVCINQ